ncbi:MAG TPA: hypothetical protein VFQ44_28685 [Streptosporangiaceae bacterium]|nr:hypothetical protein [Streptosporangiaceae bacterium]
MTAAAAGPEPGAARHAAVAAARVLLDQLGLSPADLAAAPAERTAVPTFAEYVPVVSAAVTPGTRRAYGSYWNRVIEQWVTVAWTSRPRPRSASSWPTYGPMS